MQAPPKWNVNIGLPYGTSYWQVGDSSEQNGCFQRALTKAKQDLVTKNDNGLYFVIDKRYVVKLVKEAWAASFARVRTNQKAILPRSWGPKALNFNAILHPEIISSKPGRNETASKPVGLQSIILLPRLNLLTTRRDVQLAWLPAQENSVSTKKSLAMQDK